MSEKHARRRLLELVAGGGTVIAGLNALPGKWSRPVIESVVLPAHAATSTVCELPQTIPGRTVTCADDAVNADMYYMIRTAPDPCEFEVLSNTGAPTSPYISVLWATQLGAGSDVISLSVDSRDTNDSSIGLRTIQLNCTDNEISLDNGSFPVDAEDENGDRYELTGSLSTSGDPPDTITLSILAVTKV